MRTSKQAILLILIALLASCRSVVPVSSSDSTYSTYTKKDTVFLFKPDSSSVQYLVECQKTNEGYKARIIQLLSQKPGEQVYIPTSTIDSNNVLTTKVYVPGKEIKVPVYRFYRGESKSKVFVKITNELTGWQWAQVWGGRLLIALVLIYIVVKLVKRYTGVSL